MSRRPRQKTKRQCKIDNRVQRDRAIVYWLTPAKAERELFCEIVRILAKQLDAPRFEPHLTLCLAPDRQSLSKVLRRIKLSPIRLRVRGLSCSAEFTKTLFVRFKSSRALKELIVDLGGEAKSLRDPHVSLLYKRIPARLKKELTSTIKLPFREVVFDSIKAVRCASPTKTRADIESWRVIATKRLSG